MPILWLNVLVKTIFFQEDKIAFNTQLGAVYVLATIPCIFIFTFLTNWLSPREALLHSSAGQGGGSQMMEEQIKKNDEDIGNEMVECAVCLYEVSKGEKYKVLPTCKHRYHVSCIDSWLRTNPSCPICRCEVEMDSGKTKGRFSVFISSLCCFFNGFCKPLFGFSTENIENSHYLF